MLQKTIDHSVPEIWSHSRSRLFVGQSGAPGTSKFQSMGRSVQSAGCGNPCERRIECMPRPWTDDFHLNWLPSRLNLPVVACVTPTGNKCCRRRASTASSSDWEHKLCSDRTWVCRSGWLHPRGYTSWRCSRAPSDSDLWRIVINLGCGSGSPHQPALCATLNQLTGTAWVWSRAREAAWKCLVSSDVGLGHCTCYTSFHFLGVQVYGT